MAAAHSSRPRLWSCLQLSQLAVDAGAGSALTQLLKDTPGPCRLHAAVALGYIAAHSPVLALAVIAAKVGRRSRGATRSALRLCTASSTAL